MNAIHKGLRESIVGLGENYLTLNDNSILIPHRFCLSLHPLNVFGEESFPCVALQLRKGGEQGGLEEVLREVLVQHVLQRDRLCAINLTKEKVFKCVNCSPLPEIHDSQAAVHSQSL